MICTGTLENILELNERVRIETSKWRGILTPYATEQFREIQNKCLGAGSNAMEVKIIDADKGIATTRYVSENSHTGTLVSINLSMFHCSCFKWQQAGIPCIHVYNYMAITGISDEMFSYEKKYFLPVCYTQTWRQFYDHESMRGNMPGDLDVELFMASFIRKIPILSAKLTMPREDTQPVTSKRLRGSAESATTGSIASTSMKKRITCERCGKSLAASTKHGFSACDTYQKKVLRSTEFEFQNNEDANNLAHVFSPSRNETTVRTTETDLQFPTNLINCID